MGLYSWSFKERISTGTQREMVVKWHESLFSIYSIYEILHMCQYQTYEITAKPLQIYI